MAPGSWKFRECRAGENDAIDYTVTQGADGGQCCTQDNHQERSGVKFSVEQWLKDAFLPQGYPHSVSDDYIHYQLWDTLQAYCSSVAGSVSLHAALGSLGVGQEGSTALAATLTWLTNTGTGMLAAIAFTYCKGGQLDSNNKQWRLFADVLNDGAHLVKLATPLLPLPPILPLTAAAVMFALVGVAGGATRTALTAHQARNNNLGEVAAKDGSQETLVNLAALLTSLVLLPMITSSLVITWSVFVVLLCVHLLCNYRAVRAVVAPSLNRPRLLLLLQDFQRHRTVPGLLHVNNAEPLLLGPAFRRNYLRRGWSLELGCSLRAALQACPGATDRPALQHNFMVLVSSQQQRVFVLLTKAATAQDLLLASWTAFLLADAHDTCTARRDPAEKSKDSSHPADDVDRLREKATESFPLLLQKMKEKGWDVEQLYLGVGEWRLL